MEALVWIAVGTAVVLAALALVGFVMSRATAHGSARRAAATLPPKASQDVEEPGAILEAESPVFGLLRLTREELVFVEGPTGRPTRLRRSAIEAATVVRSTPHGAELRNPALQVTYADPAGRRATVVFLVKTPSDWITRLMPVAG